MAQHSSKPSCRPSASHGLPMGTCRINCCLHRACRLHTTSTACIKESTRSTLWNFYSLCSLFFPFPFLSSFSYSPPCPPFPFSFSSATKQTRKTSLSRVFSARLPSCPEALQYLVSCSISPLSARSKTTGDEKKRRKGGVRSRRDVGKALHGARWGTVISFNYSNYRCRNTHKGERRGVPLPVDGAQQRLQLSTFISPDITTCKNTSQEHWSRDASLLWNLIFVIFFHIFPFGA